MWNTQSDRDTELVIISTALISLEVQSETGAGVQDTAEPVSGAIYVFYFNLIFFFLIFSPH